MQTALHIRALVREINREIVGGEIVGTEFYKKIRSAYFFVKAHERTTALGFVFHPGGAGTAVVPASRIAVDTTEKPWPIFDLTGAIIESVKQLGLDRLFEIRLTTPAGERSMVFESLGPNGNILLLNKEREVIATLRNREFDKNESYTPPPPRAGLNPLTLTRQQFTDAIKSPNVPAQPLATIIEKQVIGFNRTMAREVTQRAEIENVSVAELDSAAMNKVSDQIKAMALTFDTDNAIGYLYSVRSDVEVYPFKLKGAEGEPDKYKSLSMAVMNMIVQRQKTQVDTDDTKSIVTAVTKHVEKLATRLEKLRADITNAEDFERYKQHGELLQSHFPKLKRGMKSITVNDIYAHIQRPVEIALDSAITPQQNVEGYFKRHRKGKEGLELLQRRFEITQEEHSQWQHILSEIENDLESARQRYASELSTLLPKERTKTEKTVRLPYREATLSTGATIYIGRDGSDNDRTTFEFAKPYELWFHAQQCPGSHVVLKFPNKSFAPSKREIEETASIAAFHSKAKNNSAVPVIYTERRYVRKPRKAKPGLVTVEKEKSLMVVPRRAAGE